MEIWQWIEQHEAAFQNFGIIAGFLFTAYTNWKDERARKISNLIAIKAENREIWKESYARPELKRVWNPHVDLKAEPVSDAEHLFVTQLIIHLDTVHRMMKAKMFVKMKGIPRDIATFFSNPVPSVIWDELKSFQEDDFVAFVEKCRRGGQTFGK